MGVLVTFEKDQDYMHTNEHFTVNEKYYTITAYKQAWRHSIL